MYAIVIIYGVYLAVSIALTVWVARMQFTNGQRLLADVFQGDQELALSVNHLLVVGFYLMSFAFICVRMKTDFVSAREGLEALADRIGSVLFVLGMMHFMNFVAITYIRYCNTGRGRVH